MEEVKKTYEIGFLMKEESMRVEVVKLLAAHDISLEHEGKCTRISLPQPIHHEHVAVFCFFHVSADPAKLLEFRKDLTLHRAILRFLMITLPPLEHRMPPPPRAPQLKEIRPSRMQPRAPETPLRKKPTPLGSLSNEELEKKLEEILK